MNIAEVIDLTVPELIDMAKLLSDIDSRMAKINDIKYNLLNEGNLPDNKEHKPVNFYVDDSNRGLLRNRLVQINRLNRRNFESLLDLNIIIQSAYDAQRYTLYEFLNDIVPDHIVTHIFFEEYQLYNLAQSFKLTSEKTLKNKKLDVDFESNKYSFSLKYFVISWIANDFPIEALSGFIPPFVKTKAEAIKLRNACWSLYKQKYAFESGADAYEKVKYGLNSLFSMLDMDANPFGDDDVDKSKEKKTEIIVPLKGRYQR